MNRRDAIKALCGAAIAAPLAAGASITGPPVAFGVKSTPHLVGRVLIWIDGVPADAVIEGTTGTDGWVTEFIRGPNGTLLLDGSGRELRRRTRRGHVTMRMKADE